MSNFTNSTTEEPIIEEVVSKISVFTPLIYLAILITALVVFSNVYRSRRLKEFTQRKAFFGENIPKKIYLQLLALSNEEKVNEKVLKAALLRRGAESIRRTIKLKEVTPFVTALYQKGSIGDEVWQRFQTAQKLEELEIQEIVRETEKYKKGWVQKFVPLLQEICFNEALRRRYASINIRNLELLKKWEIEVKEDGTLDLPNKPTLKIVQNMGGPVPAKPVSPNATSPANPIAAAAASSSASKTSAGPELPPNFKREQ